MSTSKIKSTRRVPRSKTQIDARLESFSTLVQNKIKIATIPPSLSYKTNQWRRGEWCRSSHCSDSRRRGDCCAVTGQRRSNDFSADKTLRRSQRDRSSTFASAREAKYRFLFARKNSKPKVSVNINNSRSSRKLWHGFASVNICELVDRTIRTTWRFTYWGDKSRTENVCSWFFLLRGVLCNFFSVFPKTYFARKKGKMT